MIKKIFFVLTTVFALYCFGDLSALFEKSGNIIEYELSFVHLHTTPMGVLWLLAAIAITLLLGKRAKRKQKEGVILGFVHYLSLGYVIGFVLSFFF